MNQDPLGIQGSVVVNDTNNQFQVWAKPLQSGDVAVAVVNFSNYGNDEVTRLFMC